MSLPWQAGNPETTAPQRAHRNWRHPLASLTLAEGAVHVWRIPLAAPPSLVARLHLILSDEEKERAARMLAPAVGRRFVVSHGATRDILARYLAQPAEQIRFVTSARGKPHLAHPPGAPGLFFNLSHSGELALCALAQARDVGVDLEQIRPLKSWPQIAERYFSPGENEALGALSRDRAVEAFFRGWTRKEAYSKALGQGVSRQWAQFTVCLAAGATTELPAAGTGSGVQDVFTLWPLAPAEGYAAAVAARGTDWRPDCWHWPGPGNIA